ncbi:MAG: DGQHR domain-containing protein [Archangium sp.]|nr:DGQHR domain-containing protein [Archangium sp.]MDP3576296.1 DGQHR domain-containing protein [Archangium sp.]
MQPIGEFWVASIPAQVLRRTTNAPPLRMVETPTKPGWPMAGKLAEAQRAPDEKRMKQIAAFIGTFDATFPNSIILAVDDASGDDDVAAPWKIEVGPKGLATLSIPEGARQASVVDGQHRLFAFDFVKEPPDRFDLLCAIFFGLPEPVQAFVFATINTNQKPVRRGLAMNLYGYNVDDQSRNEWSPEKLAVFMARRLNFEKDSPLHQRVKIEAEGAPTAEALPGAKRAIPMAAVVDAALGLLTRNPKRDRDQLKARTLFRVKRSDLEAQDGAALRGWYLEERDADTYALLKAYFQVVEEKLWSGERALLTRAVDIRALGDFLADIARPHAGRKQSEVVSAVVETSTKVFAKARAISFDDPFFEATYRGRRRVENVLRLVSGEKILDQVPPDDRPHYERLVRAK